MKMIRSFTFIMALVATHIARGENRALLLGGHCESPDFFAFLQGSLDNTMARSINRTGKVLEARGWNVKVSFSSTKSVYRRDLDFSRDAILHEFQQAANDLQEGDQFFVQISTHGAPRGPVRDHAICVGKERIQLNELAIVKPLTLLRMKGVRVGMIDNSCFGGATVDALSKYACVVSTQVALLPSMGTPAKEEDAAVFSGVGKLNKKQQDLLFGWMGASDSIDRIDHETRSRFTLLDVYRDTVKNYGRFRDGKDDFYLGVFPESSASLSANDTAYYFANEIAGPENREILRQSLEAQLGLLRPKARGKTPKEQFLETNAYYAERARALLRAQNQNQKNDERVKRGSLVVKALQTAPEQKDLSKTLEELADFDRKASENQRRYSDTDAIVLDIMKMWGPVAPVAQIRLQDLAPVLQKYYRPLFDKPIGSKIGAFSPCTVIAAQVIECLTEVLPTPGTINFPLGPIVDQKDYLDLYRTVNSSLSTVESSMKIKAEEALARNPHLKALLDEYRKKESANAAVIVKDIDTRGDRYMLVSKMRELAIEAQLRALERDPETAGFESCSGFQF